MPYSFHLHFPTGIDAEKAADKIMSEQGSGKKPDRHGRDITLMSQDAAQARRDLTFLRGIAGAAQIRVRDEDGWECEEIDLMDESEREALCTGMSAGQNIRGDSGLHSGTDQGQETPKTTASPQSAPRLVLASQSPRRTELLGLIGIPFTASAADVDENLLAREAGARFEDKPFSVRAACTVMTLAAAKARNVLSDNPDAVVIGSDTIVTIDDSILGKPSSPEHALAMLHRLSGRDHHVFTGVSIQTRGREETFFSGTRVGFYPWCPCEEELARRYIAGGSPLDKAGAYGIQDLGALFIRGIKGDYYTVVGFPVAEIYRRLQNFGFINPKK